MERLDELGRRVALSIAPEAAQTELARQLAAQFSTHGTAEDLVLRLDGEGLALVCGDQSLRGDFAHMLPRLKSGRLGGELLVRAARIKDADHPLTALDATAGLGEDSLLLAAAGFRVTLFERNPVIFQLLQDALRRAAQIPELEEAVGRMTPLCGDSVAAMAALETAPDVILLDPMFPARQKSALVKKKLQMIQKLETPCANEEELLFTAMATGVKKLIVKRPPKGPWLAGIKPDYAIEGKAVRFDCFASPGERLHKFQSKR